MKNKIENCCFAVALAISLLCSLGKASTSIADQKPTMMNPVTVIERPITLLVCSAHFRFNLPGAGLKYLVIRKAPAWCAGKGLEVGDYVEAVDRKEIAGQGLIPFTKESIAKKFDNSPKPVHFVLSIRSPKESQLKLVDVSFDDARKLSIVYP